MDMRTIDILHGRTPDTIINLKIMYIVAINFEGFYYFCHSAIQTNFGSNSGTVSTGTASSSTAENKMTDRM